jgi:ribose-phosphate pyrophosphokinase
MTLKLLALPGDEEFAAGIAADADADVLAAEIRRFPDGESYLRVGDPVEGCSVAVVARLDRPDDKIPPLLFASAMVRDLGAAHVGLLAPYLPYMRQDDRFRAGEALTSATFAAWISSQFDWLVTVDPHLHRYPALDAIYSLEARALNSAPLIAEWIRRNVVDPVVIGPDSESEQWARAVAEIHGVPWRVLEKTRYGDRDVAVTAEGLDAVRHCNPVIVDDICSSGATLAQAARSLSGEGLAPARCAVVHGLFDDRSRAVLAEVGIDDIVCTDSTQAGGAIELASIIAPVIAELAGGGRA